MNTHHGITGKIKFRVGKQDALLPFQQKMMSNYIAAGGEMPEELRFQCRIATDARKALSHIDLPNGETITLHHTVMPQFGETGGLAYLTATVIYSGDGEAYRLKWVGNNLPRKMVEVAVKHDEGKRVAATTVYLDLDAAQITKSTSRKNRDRNPVTEKAAKERYEAKYLAENGISARKARHQRKSRSCGRATRETLAAMIPDAS